MATTRKPVAAPPARAAMERPRPGSRDYTQPPPGGPTYPWSPGGTSKQVGVPDNWADYYPSEQAGRGDAWLAVKQGPGGRLDKDAPRQPYVPAPKDHKSVEYGAWLDKYGGPFTGDTWAMNNRSASGQMGPNWDVRRPPPGAPTREEWFAQHPDPLAGQLRGTARNPTENALRMHGVKPGPLNTIGGTPGDAGTYTGKDIVPPAKKGEKPATNEQLGKWFATMKPGATMDIQGKRYLKNQNGAIVDVTNPTARKRITNRQGAFIGQAAAPPPPGATPPPATPPPGTPPPAATPPPGAAPPPATAPPPAAAPPTYPPTNQNPYQYDPYQLNQFGYPQGQGPGPYGWNPGYGGPPFNYSNFSNALMQGMGGGYQQRMPINASFDMGGYGGGYGMPQSYFPEAQMMTNEMGGYGGGMGGFGFDPYAMGQGMMGYY